MTDTRQLLLKLQTGHGPFRVRNVAGYDWNRWDDGFERAPKGTHGNDDEDHLYWFCECCGHVFCGDCCREVIAVDFRIPNNQWEEQYVRLDS